MEAKKSLKIIQNKIYVGDESYEWKSEEEIAKAIQMNFPFKEIILENLCFQIEKLSDLFINIGKYSDKETVILVIESKEKETVDKYYRNKLFMFSSFPDYIEFLNEKYNLCFSLIQKNYEDKIMFSLNMESNKSDCRIKREEDNLNNEEILSEISFITKKVGVLLTGERKYYGNSNLADENYRELYYEIKNSKIWRWTGFIRKFMDFFRRKS